MNHLTRPKKKPKWYQFRWKISSLLVELARKIKPDNPDVMAFHVDLMTELVLTGKAGVCVSVAGSEQYKEEQKAKNQKFSNIVDKVEIVK